MRKTTRADFTRFKKTFRRWQDRFGLNEWMVRYFHDEIPDRLAELSAHYCGMKADVTLGKQHLEEKHEGIDVSAFHEATELLLQPLFVLANDRVWDKEIWDAESHRVVHRLARAFGVLK